MKTYKTWEVIKMLAEDPKLKFEGKALNKLTKILSVNEHGILKCL